MKKTEYKVINLRIPDWDRGLMEYLERWQDQRMASNIIRNAMNKYILDHYRVVERTGLDENGKEFCYYQNVDELSEIEQDIYWDDQLKCLGCCKFGPEKNDKSTSED